MDVSDNRPVHIVTAADDNYMPHAGAMLHSLFESNPDYEFTVHFLHRKAADPKNIEKLNQLCLGKGVMFHSVSVDADFLRNWPVNSRYVEEAWYRLKLPSLLPGIDKVLWLDADVLVLDDIGELWMTDMGDRAVAAVCNAISPDDADLPKKLELPLPEKYFNSGVMLISLDTWRRENVEVSFERVIESHHPFIKYADQDVLNVVYNQYFYPLDLRWNAMTGIYFYPRDNNRVHGWCNLVDAWHRPAIIHFTGNSFKPWQADNRRHPYCNQYLRHRKRAGWELPESGKIGIRRRVLRSLPAIVWLMLSRLRQRKFGDVYWLVKTALAR